MKICEINDLSIIVTHCDNFYLKECLSILCRIKVLKGLSIQTDGFRNLYTGDGVDKKTSHNLCHGYRAYELVRDCTTKKILIMDADFFCADEAFWVDAIESSKKYDLVSIGSLWKGLFILPTTPFFICDCKRMLERVPVQDLWGHFLEKWPELGAPIFDHMKFPFLTAKDSTKCIDHWHPFSQRKYSFFHFWDSRHSFLQNFKDFNEGRGSLEYLSYGVSKSIYFYSKKGEELPERIWSYIELLASADTDYLRNVRDVMANLYPQLNYGNCSELIKKISEKFFIEFEKKKVL